MRKIIALLAGILLVSVGYVSGFFGGVTVGLAMQINYWGAGILCFVFFLLFFYCLPTDNLLDEVTDAFKKLRRRK